MLEPTDTVFHLQPYQTQLKVSIQSFEHDEKGRPLVILNRTICYPQGGGQKGDRGTLTLPNGTPVGIIDTRKNGEIIHHYVEATSDETIVLDGVGKTLLDLDLDWAHRHQQMRIHSAAHLIHCFLEVDRSSELPPPRQSPLTSEGGENQYDYSDRFDEAALERATARMNDFLNDGSHPITTYADEHRGHGSRWWKCDDWTIPCGGVHPADASEVGAVSTSMRVKKGKARVSVQLGS